MKASSLVLALPPLVVLTLDLPSSSRGMYFPGITQSAPACGACHRSAPGAAPGFAPIVLAVTPSARALAANQSITLAVTVSGGQNASTHGGFALDANAGTFSAGANTSVVPPGDAITHANSSVRSWSFGYSAPAAPGLIELFAVSNTVDNDQMNDDDDMWAFHGSDDTATQGTPVRLYVNAAGVVGFGASCVGAFGNVPVLGCPQSPTLGNGTFSFAVHGAAPSTVAGVLLGVTPFDPGLDLGLVGVTGCRLHVDPLLTVFGGTSSGDPKRGEGSASFPLPIPADQSLLGAVLQAQAFVLDSGSGRPTPLTMTNALRVTIQ